MAHVFHFKPGAQQAIEANHYFRSVAGDLADRSITRMQDTQFILQEPGHRELRVRNWTFPEDNGKFRLPAPWLRQAMWTLNSMSDRDVDPLAYLSSMQACGRTTCFTEVLGQGAFNKNEEQLLTIGLREGTPILLSSRQVIYVALEPDLFGLAIFERGSWLIEQKPASQEAVHNHR